MKEAFAAIYDAPDRVEGERRLEVWVSNLEAADLPDLVTVWKQLARWRERILAYFDDGMTNAFAGRDHEQDQGDETRLLRVPRLGALSSESPVVVSSSARPGWLMSTENREEPAFGPPSSGCRRT
jgi:hypothetical protein